MVVDDGTGSISVGGSPEPAKLVTKTLIRLGDITAGWLDVPWKIDGDC